MYFPFYPSCLISRWKNLFNFGFVLNILIYSIVIRVLLLLLYGNYWCFDLIYDSLWALLTCVLEEGIFSIVSVWCYTCIYLCVYVWLHTQFILIIHGFHICEFAYLLKFIYNSKVNFGGTFVVICGLVPVQSGEKFESLDTWIPSWGWTSWGSAFCFSSHTVNVLFIMYLVPHFSHFCAFCWRFHCLKWLSKHRRLLFLGLVSALLFSFRFFSPTALHFQIELHPSTYSSGTCQSCSKLSAFFHASYPLDQVNSWLC